MKEDICYVLILFQAFSIHVNDLLVWNNIPYSSIQLQNQSVQIHVLNITNRTYVAGVNGVF